MHACMNKPLVQAAVRRRHLLRRRNAGKQASYKCDSSNLLHPCSSLRSSQSLRWLQTQLDLMQMPSVTHINLPLAHPVGDVVFIIVATRESDSQPLMCMCVSLTSNSVLSDWVGFVGLECVTSGSEQWHALCRSIITEQRCKWSHS